MLTLRDTMIRTAMIAMEDGNMLRLLNATEIKADLNATTVQVSPLNVPTTVARETTGAGTDLKEISTHLSEM